MAATYSQDQVEKWLRELAAGTLCLKVDNQSLAQSALALLKQAPPAPTPAPLPPGYLAPHFTLEEFTRSDTAAARGIDNTPTKGALEELALLARTMEKVRKVLGDKPVYISSGYRCPELNDAVGGATNSAHLFGAAADFTVPDFGTVLECCHALEPHLVALEVDQLIYENDSWIHLGRAPGANRGTPRHQCLTISGGSTIEGIA